MARTQAHSIKRNRLAVDPDREQRVRERAYHLWEAEGKPHGRDVEYWERARELIGIEESAGSLPPSNPPTAPGSPGESRIEEPGTQSSSGEFRDRPADQGEGKAAPKRRARAKPRKPA